MKPSDLLNRQNWSGIRVCPRDILRLASLVQCFYYFPFYVSMLSLLLFMFVAIFPIKGRRGLVETRALPLPVAAIAQPRWALLPEVCIGWRQSTRALPVAPVPSQHAKCAGRNCQDVSRRRRRGRPSRSQRQRQGHRRTKAYKTGFPKARLGRRRTEWAPSEQAFEDDNDRRDAWLVL